MAFHLHRLGLVGRALREAGSNVHDAADIAAARTALTATSYIDLAERLGIAVQQLTRGLGEDEIRSWSFYRRAAAHPHYVWASARAAWQAANCTDKQAAKIMGIHKGNIPHTISKPQRRALSFEQAARLTTALNIIAGPKHSFQTPTTMILIIPASRPCFPKFHPNPPP